MFISLYWYKAVFMTELLLVCGLFTYKLKKRSHFAWRVLLSALCLYAVTFAIQVPVHEAWFTTLLFTALFVLVLIAIKICYDEPWMNVLFCGIVCYTVRHLAYLIYNFIVIAFDLAEKGMVGAYLNVAGKNDVNPLTMIVYFVVYYIVYWIMYLLFGRQIKRKQDLRIDNVPLIFISIVIMLVDVVFNAVTVYYSAENFHYTYLVIEYLYGIISCCLVLFILFTLLGKKKLKQEFDTLQTLWRQQQKQYNTSKGNIELINIKCHDLKHQLSTLKGRIDENEYREIEKAVLIYDSFVKTGNEALDVILTEKGLFCEKNGIQLSCIVDKSKLDFISISDLYALFGNIIDNAVEAVLKVDDPKKKVISLNIKSADKFISIHADNFFHGKIKFEDGLPVTLKEDKVYHGFGMKSIRHITEKYGGNLLVRAAGELFKLDILIPVQDIVPDQM